MQLILGDSRVVLKDFDDNYFDSVVTDPPYGLTSITKRFGKTSVEDDNKTGERAKSRADGYDRLARGFMGEVWDGSGIQDDFEFWEEVYRVMKPGAYLLAFGGTRTYHRMASAIESACAFEIRDCLMWLYGQGMPKNHNIGKQVDKLLGNDRETITKGTSEWEGWGTNLKPACEPIVMARKPISEKTIVENILKWGTGGINIDDSRIELENGEIIPINVLESWSGFGQEVRPNYTPTVNTQGRWPSNLLLDEDSASMLDEQVGSNVSRFFYCAKPSKTEKGVACNHPTVKPVELMKYLVKLVTPKNGVVLDPFMGSGTTGLACRDLEYNFIGIEKEPSYFSISRQRLGVADRAGE